MSRLYDISVENFGPLTEAKINLLPLTIFVGKNSSGKSLLSSLIKSLYNPFNGNSYEIPNNSLNYLIDNKLFKHFEKSLNTYLNSKPSFSDDPFTYSLNDFTVLINEGFGKCYAKLIENELKNTFKCNLNDLNRMKIHPFEIEFRDINFKNQSNELKTFNLESKLYELIKSIDIFNPIGIKINSNNNNIKIKIDYDLIHQIYEENILIPHIIYGLVVNKLIDLLKSNIYHIPANIDIFKDFNNYISNEINGINSSSNIQKELVSKLLNLNKGTKKGYFYDLACNLEKEIYNGEIRIKKGDFMDELVFADETYDLEFDLNIVSSSVHELIPIVIYLKYYLNKGDILILEEIENHLHPENQLILVKYLVKAMNMGLNILLTTHSDYIIEKFNNLLQLGNTKKEVFTKLNYDETCILDYKDLAIYNFKKFDEYNYIPSLIEVNFTGFIEDTFEPVVNELYDESDIMDEFKLR